jgi:hypothetical protein
VNQESLLENKMIFAKEEMADNRDVECLQDKDSAHVETFSLASLEYLKKCGLEVLMKIQRISARALIHHELVPLSFIANRICLISDGK